MPKDNLTFEPLVDELRIQGLIVSVHDDHNHTWFIKGEGIYNGYVVTGEELEMLRRANELNLKGVKSLG